MIIYVNKYRICAKYAYEEEIINLDILCDKCPLYHHCHITPTGDEILNDIMHKCSFSNLLEGVNSEDLYITSITPTNMYKLFL